MIADNSLITNLNESLNRLSNDCVYVTTKFLMPNNLFILRFGSYVVENKGNL